VLLQNFAGTVKAVNRNTFRWPVKMDEVFSSRLGGCQVSTLIVVSFKRNCRPSQWAVWTDWQMCHLSWLLCMFLRLQLNASWYFT